MPHILITGASRRLGLLLCQHFLAQQWQVTALSRSASPELAALAGENLEIITLDYGDSAQVASLCQQLQQQPLDVIIHNASYFAPDAADLFEGTAQLVQMMQTHVYLPQQLNRALAERLKASDNGNIIQMSDIYVTNPNEGFSNYCASKAAAENLANSFAKLLAPKVRVNSIQPGALAFLPEHSEEAQTEVLENSLLKFAAGFEPIIQTIDYILANPFITATAIKVDGGRALCR